MRSLAILLIGSLLFAPLLAQSTLTYDDAQTIVKPPGQKEGKTIDGNFIIDPGRKELSFKSEKGVDQFNIPYDRVTSLLYERTARPRYVSAILLSPFFLLAKGKKHFLTIQYKDAAGQGQYAIVRLNKKNYQDCLAALEAQTGKKVDRTEER